MTQITAKLIQQVFFVGFIVQIERYVAFSDVDDQPANMRPGRFWIVEIPGIGLQGVDIYEELIDPVTDFPCFSTNDPMIGLGRILKL